MKKCTPIVLEEYDGELYFSIIDYQLEPDACVMTLGAQDGEELVGFKISVPMTAKRVLFKNFNFIHPTGTVKFSTIGEKSDRLIASLVKYFNPSYEAEGFTDEVVEIDYKLRNQGAYDINTDKIYLRLFYDEDQDEGLPKEERVHLNMNFTFNLSREMASLIETEEGYSADLIAFLMK
jgi:hypothetical protein